MIKGTVLILAIIAVALFPTFGCITSDAPITPASDYAANAVIWDSYGPRIVAVEAYGPRIVALEGRPTGSSGGSFDSTALNNKDNDLQNQINAMRDKNTDGSLQAQIDALSAKMNNFNPATDPNFTPTSDTGIVTFTNNPVSIPQIFSSSSGGNSNPWIMTIHNGSTTWQYVKPMISLNVSSGQSQSTVSEVLVMTSGGSCSLTGTYSAGATTGNFTFSPTSMNITATPSIVAFPISGCNGSGEWYIGPGQTQSYNIQVQGLKTPNPILWNVSASISSRSM